MKKMKKVGLAVVGGIFLLLIAILLLSGCGGGGGTPVVPVPPTLDEGMEPPIPENPGNIIIAEGDVVSWISAASSGAVSDDTYLDYSYQVGMAGEEMTTGAKIHGSCREGCDYSRLKAPVTFRVYDGSIQLGATEIVTTNDWGVATMAVILPAVAQGSTKTITVRATVEDLSVLSKDSFWIPTAELEIGVLPEGTEPKYAAVTDQEISVTLVSGQRGGSWPYFFPEVRVKNTGNMPWYNLSNRKNRVYMVTVNATGSQFFDSSSWYDRTVVSDATGYRILPGDTGSVSFSLSAEGIPAGQYRECFKLQTKPEAIDSSWDYFRLVNPIDVEGGEFCININILPESLEWEATDYQEPTTEEFPGRLYWERKLSSE
ncbi:hypothetical protein HYV44_00755 [Candidatus Microgenomates bacterium]|nr:hypothetical protein [Candidatus Microgenomates bacterium]